MSKSSIRILGIDAGTAITGWAIIERPIASRRAPRLVGVGNITTHKLANEVDRLVDLGNSIQDLIEEYSPDHMAIEDLFFFKNAKTVIKVAQARGAVMYQAKLQGIEVYSYTPLQIKQQITGYGRAKKEQVQLMINKLFKLNGKLKQDDAADALAAAYIHSLNLD